MTMHVTSRIFGAVACLGILVPALSAQADTVNCITGVTVTSIITEPNNGDNRSNFSVVMSNGVTYAADGQSNLNDLNGEANFSLLTAAFAAGYQVTLTNYNGNCGTPATFTGVTLTK